MNHEFSKNDTRPHSFFITHHSYFHLDDLPDELRHGALAIGKFDGVHLGHARIVERLLAMAQRLAGPAVAFTFDPLPAQILHPGRAPAPLCWVEQKAELLTRLGVDAVVVYPTDKDFLQLDARVFFDQILLGRLGARGIVEGPDFVFGHNRLGTVERLRQFCQEAGIILDVVDRVELDGRVVSSSRIRALLAAGQVDQVHPMLSRPYRVRGTVVRGVGRGVELGYPTANVQGVDTLLPGEGVYAGRAWAEGTPWPAAMSVGPNPTFAESAPKLEAHLIEYQGSLYDQTIELDFLARLRDIERFDSVDQLVAQMDLDVANSREIVQQYESQQP